MAPNQPNRPFRKPGRRCVRLHLQTNQCFRLCKPEGGIGQCGNPAPHGMKSRYQLAIEAYDEAK